MAGKMKTLTLARYICSPLMQSELSELYRNYRPTGQPPNLISQPDQALRCGFPSACPTTIQGICLRFVVTDAGRSAALVGAPD